MNLAILLGVSKYKQPQNDLPGCKNDIEMIHKLIQKTGKFQDILYISQDTDSQNVKTQVSEFIRHYKEKGTKVDEIFFYYTGHGLFDNDEFHFILTDYDSQWLNTTTYKNSEIDELLKSLNPDLTVKVIDACNSGVRYVKDVSNAEVNKILNVSKQNFKNCYFMFSSQLDEFSYADKTISYFTESFINAVMNHENKGIRYQHIADYITDDFSQRSITQTPFFITQTSNTEIFCNVDESMKKILKDHLTSLKGGQVIQEDKVTTNKLSLLEIIKKDAENYCNDISEVQDILNKIKENIESFFLNDDLREVYTINTDFLDEQYTSLPSIDSVAKTLEGDAPNFFIELDYAEKTVRTPLKPSGIELARVLVTQESPRTRYKEEVKSVINSFYISEEDVPYTAAKIDLVPNFPNVPKYNLTLIYAFSKVHIKLFYSFNIYKEVSWGFFELDEVKWRQSKKFIIKNEEEIKMRVDSLKLEFKHFIERDLKQMFKNELDDNTSTTIGTVGRDKLSKRPGHPDPSEPTVPAHKV
ncbi:caspase family protein [Priestia megaterium]|uniref:caspase family protein n=1 Tax=Priestia megaterium TaxID=1404 RepID=UPI00234F9D34|nr:caspase family protein [Priestia megaterium]MDC7783206.1 caspase family protein [Priestia megaterium]